MALNGFKWFFEHRYPGHKSFGLLHDVVEGHEKIKEEKREKREKEKRNREVLLVLIIF
jgi:hypothetical protein